MATLQLTLSCAGSTAADTEPDPAPTAEHDPTCLPSDVPADWTYPAGPYGTEVGDTFESFTMRDCERNDVGMGELLHDANLVLFNVGAGWCAPCITETITLQEEVADRFCDRGLKVVQVLFQDAQAQPATSLFCQQWKEQYELDLPVLIDPLFNTAVYLDADQNPLNMLVDPSGTIIWRRTGEAPTDLADFIDATLPP